MNLARRRLSGLRPAVTSHPRAADTMVRAVRVVPAWTPVADLLSGARPGAVYPVLDPGGALVGILDLAELTGRAELHDRLAGEVCQTVDAMFLHAPEDWVVLGRRPGLVLEGGRLIGILPAAAGRRSTHYRRKAS